MDFNWFMVACPGVHLSEGSLVRGLGVNLFGGSLVRGSLVRTSRSTMTFLAEIEAVLMKRTLYRFGVATPRGRQSQSDAVLLKYMWAMLFCWSIVAKFPLRFPLYFNFCDLMLPDWYCVADLLNGSDAGRL